MFGSLLNYFSFQSPLTETNARPFYIKLAKSNANATLLILLLNPHLELYERAKEYNMRL